MAATILDEFTKQYIITALWSSSDQTNDQGGEPLDKNYDLTSFESDALAAMIADCEKFQSENYDDISSNLGRAGHDFWLTRNGHGAGFWDGDWDDEIGKRLTAASKAYGECDIYVTDDNTLSIFSMPTVATA